MKKVDSSCIVETRESRIKFEENKRKIIFLNPGARPYKKVQVDGCAIRQGLKCDNLLVSGDESEERYVELKGKDVMHAVEQLEATIRELGQHAGNRHAYIICTKVLPAYDTRIQGAQKMFRKQYNSALVVKANQLSVDLG